MTSAHENLCDGNHTTRQACNSALDLVPAQLSTPRAIGSDATSGPTLLEGPNPAGTASAPVSVLNESAESVEHEFDTDHPFAPHTQQSVMPAPSPWAVRAWEDTAAAVGATATPAPPPAVPTADSNGATRLPALTGHLPLLAGIAGAAALAILVVRRRR